MRRRSPPCRSMPQNDIGKPYATALDTYKMSRGYFNIAKKKDLEVKQNTNDLKQRSDVGKTKAIAQEGRWGCCGGCENAVQGLQPVDQKAINQQRGAKRQPCAGHGMGGMERESWWLALAVECRPGSEHFSARVMVSNAVTPHTSLKKTKVSSADREAPRALCGQ